MTRRRTAQAENRIAHVGCYTCNRLIDAADLNGVTIVFSHSAEPTLLALNRLNDRFAASAAIAGKEMFLRGEKYLYCIAEE